jgi:hypothetical protein
MRGYWRSRRGLVGQILPANGQESSQFPNWDEMGIPPGFFWRVLKLIRCRELRNIQFLGVRKLFILLGLRRCVDRTKAT